MILSGKFIKPSHRDRYIQSVDQIISRKNQQSYTYFDHPAGEFVIRNSMFFEFFLIIEEIIQIILLRTAIWIFSIKLM